MKGTFPSGKKKERDDDFPCVFKENIQTGAARVRKIFSRMGRIASLRLRPETAVSCPKGRCGSAFRSGGVLPCESAGAGRTPVRTGKEQPRAPAVRTRGIVMASRKNLLRTTPPVLRRIGRAAGEGRAEIRELEAGRGGLRRASFPKWTRSRGVRSGRVPPAKVFRAARGAAPSRDTGGMSNVSRVLAGDANSRCVVTAVNGGFPHGRMPRHSLKRPFPRRAVRS